MNRKKQSEFAFSIAAVSRCVALHKTMRWSWLSTTKLACFAKLNYSSRHIRPLAVRPLTYPECVPTPWGFSFSGSAKFSCFAKIATSVRGWV